MRPALEPLAWTLAFSLSYAQSPLYTSNQNQYFLHGLARAGVGFLARDWLANTADPTPLFSLMVEALADWPWLFYLVYAALMGVYLFSVLAIVSSVFDLCSTTKRRLTLAALVVLHSAALRYLLAQLAAPEAEFLLEGGVAGQRLLGVVLQPSAFGVFLVLSLALFLGDRWVGAVASLAVAAAVHPTYLPSACMLLAIYVVMQGWAAQGRRQAAVMALLGVVLLAPTAAYIWFEFRPPGPELYARAADILIRLRLPHHAIPAKWLDLTVALQGLIVVGAIIIGRRSRLFPLLLAGALLVVLLTAVQMWTGNATLALAFPWRLSTVLVPVSTACLAAGAVAAGVDRLAARPAALRALATLTYLAVGLAMAAGVYRFAVERRQQSDDPAAPMMAFVAASLSSGQRYFVPPKLQDFRLRTGAPIVVEAKAVPYRAGEVTEWFDRLTAARNFFRGRPEWIHCAAFETAQEKYGATHIVLGPEQLGVDCPQLEEVFNDGQYAVYRIALTPDPSPALREPLAPHGVVRGWGEG
jgi:hypothetical protein